jgi:hypothetical protein
VDQFNSPRPLAHKTALAKELVFRRIAEASLRMARKSQNVQELTMQLFAESACTYFESAHRPTVSECYRELACSALDACGTLSYLPSERSFRRRVTSEAEIVAKALTRRARGHR